MTTPPAAADSQDSLDDLPPYLVPHSPEPVRVIYVDDELLLIHKPDLLLSVPGRHRLNHDCMITRLQAHYPDALVVHRLDLDTSGIMIVARGKVSQAALSRLFQERAVDKHYRAWVAGTVIADDGKIEVPIARDWENRPLQKICTETGKNSLTYFRVLARKNGNSYLELHPFTGRTHQLRIHCRELGHPILGCDMYAPPAILGAAPRLMLHATRIAFVHPFTGRKLVGHSPAPF
ncbi:MAG: RluA family pseudouridine synthase [Congregibacter sp.]|nr:RluA family pseudouridine synthase [Congregibacter sp.]